MPESDFISLRRARLKFPERWERDGTGLTFVFPRLGVGECVSGSEKFRFSAEETVVFAGRGAIVALSGEMEFQYFRAATEHLFPLLDASEFRFLPSVVSAFRRGKVYARTALLTRECQTLLRDVPAQCDLQHRSQLLRIAGVILSEEFERAVENPALAGVEDRVSRLWKDLRAEDVMRLTAPELAAKFHCSQRHLNRLFHRAFGRSLASLKMELRLSRAALLLRDPEAKISRVAAECGFSHLGLFHACFKRRYGTSPSRWRQLQMKEPPMKEANGEENGKWDGNLKAWAKENGEKAAPAAQLA